MARISALLHRGEDLALKLRAHRAQCASPLQRVFQGTFQLIDQPSRRHGVGARWKRTAAIERVRRLPSLVSPSHETVDSRRVTAGTRPHTSCTVTLDPSLARALLLTIKSRVCKDTSSGRMPLHARRHVALPNTPSPSSAVRGE